MSNRFLPLIFSVVSAAILMLTGGAIPQIAGTMSLRTTDSLHLTSQDSARALKQLESDLNAIVAKYNPGKSSMGILVRSLGQPRTLFALNPDLPLTPASTTKLVTTFTALRELGADYAISTILASADRPDNGVVHGDMYIRGHGDPYFSMNDLDELIDQAEKAGIRRIEGNIVGDATFMDDKFQRIQYSGDNEVVEATPPICALSVNRNQFTVIISSPREPGLPLNVQTYPRSSGFEIVNTAVSVGRAKKPAPNRPLKVKSKPSRTSVPRPAGRQKKKSARSGRHSYYLQPDGTGTGPYHTAGQRFGDAWNTGKTPDAGTVRTGDPSGGTSPGGLKVDVAGGADQKQVITVSGGLGVNRTVSFKYQMKNPGLIIAGIVLDRLESRGITITGKPWFGQAPARRVVIASVNRSLLETLTYLMKHSDNYLAECTFKIVGGKNGGLPETAPLARQAEIRQMNACGIPFGSCQLNDGSGLSRRNRLTATALCGILTAAYRDKKLFKALYSTMSIAGQDGTLRKRMRGTFAQGNVHGKTGTLNNVSALTGYVTTKNGEMLAFSMLMNGGSGFHPLQDNIAQRLAAFNYLDAIRPATDSTLKKPAVVKK